MATTKQKQISKWQEISGYNGAAQDVKDFMSEIYDKTLQGMLWDVYRQWPTEMTVEQLQSTLSRIMDLARVE